MQTSFSPRKRTSMYGILATTGEIPSYWMQLMGVRTRAASVSLRTCSPCMSISNAELMGRLIGWAPGKRLAQGAISKHFFKFLTYFDRYGCTQLPILPGDSILARHLMHSFISSTHTTLPMQTSPFPTTVTSSSGPYRQHIHGEAESATPSAASCIPYRSLTVVRVTRWGPRGANCAVEISVFAATPDMRDYLEYLDAASAWFISTCASRSWTHFLCYGYEVFCRNFFMTLLGGHAETASCSDSSPSVHEASLITLCLPIWTMLLHGRRFF